MSFIFRNIKVKLYVSDRMLGIENMYKLPSYLSNLKQVLGDIRGIVGNMDYIF